MPAISKAALDVSTVGPSPSSSANHGAITSNEPHRLLRTTAAFRYTGVSVYLCAWSALASRRATPPSAGEQNMNFVNG